MDHEIYWQRFNILLYHALQCSYECKNTFFNRSNVSELKTSSFEGMSCVTCNTPGKRAPFIDRVASGVYLATGGCGEGAATCEEIGRIAATLAVEDIWDSDIDRKICSAKLRNLTN